MQLLLKSFLLLTFLILTLASCQLSPVEEIQDGSIQTKENSFAENDKIGLIRTEAIPSTYFLKLGFLCEPEMNESYTKRAASLVNRKIFALFFGKNDKFLVKKSLVFNSKLIAYVEITAPIYDRTEKIQLQVKNRTLSVTRDYMNRPVLLPDSVCDN
ncbi:MAG: hypothetical protein H7328_11665 [Bdellovibrio sp.]|nr:hypothetical protein [Bdellovibrio sp.]